MSVVRAFLSLGAYGGMPYLGTDTEFDTHWTVECDTVNDNPATILAAGVLPNRLDPHPDNAYAVSRTAKFHREEKAPLIWRVTIHYSATPLTPQEEAQQIPNPSDRPAKIKWDFVPYQVPVLFGYKFVPTAIVGQYAAVAVPIVNSAGDQPDPVPETTEYFLQASIEKNIPDVPAWANDGYAGSLNASGFTIESLYVEPEHARLTNLSISERLKEGPHHYRQLNMVIETRTRREQRTDEDGNLLTSDVPPPPFHLELPDVGLHKIEAITLKRKRIMTEDTTPRPVSQPVPLNGSGETLANPTPYDIVLGNWRICKLRDFSVLTPYLL